MRGKRLAGGYPKEVAAGGMVGADCWVEACDAALHQCFACRWAFALEPSVIEFDAASKVESEMLAFCNYLLGMLGPTKTTFRSERRHLRTMNDFMATGGVATASRIAYERQVTKALRIPESLGRRLKVHTAWGRPEQKGHPAST